MPLLPTFRPFPIRTMRPASYRPDIDGLRAVAVLAVVFCHTELFGLTGGYVGVDVFFVISGYLITGLILKDLRQGTFTFSDFWERRIRRIAPALIVVVASTLAAGWLLLLPEDYESLGESVVAVALLASNVRFYSETGYFAAAAEEKPLLHTWSLAVEEQFYLVIPAALVLLARLGLLSRTFLIGSAVAAASFALSVLESDRDASGSFYLLHSRSWELLAGSLLAASPINLSAVTRPWSNLTALVGLGMILSCCFIYDSTTPFPGIGAIPPVGGAIMIIAAGSTRDRLPWVCQVLASRPFVFVGLISYSVYLWHWPLVVFTRHYLVYPVPTAGRLILVIASLGVGYLSWRYIETPFRYRTFLASRGRVVMAGALSFGALLSAGLVLHVTHGISRRIPEETKRYLETSRRDMRFMVEHEAADVPNGLTRFGSPGSGASILVWGDSHAMSALPAIDAAGRDAGIEIIAATHSSTAPVLGYYSKQRFGLNEESLLFNEAVADFAADNKVRAIILIASWESYAKDAGFRPALFATVDRLRDARIPTYFMMDVPIYHFDVAKALMSYSWRSRKLNALAMTPEQYVQNNSNTMKLIPGLRARGVTILDPIPAFQTRSGSALLPPGDTGGSFYSDGHHLSVYGSNLVRPLFDAIIQSLRESNSA